MQFDYSHSLGIDEARARILVLCAYLKNRHGIAVKWKGNEGRVDGKYLVVTISGTMTIEENRVRFSGADPGFLWRKKAVHYLEGKLATYLDPNTPIEDLPTDKQ